jgi:hypothetical protein
MAEGRLSETNRLRLLPLEAHHTHNKPPSTILATTTAMLPTTQYMNSSYSMERVLGKLCSMPLRSCLPMLFP